MDKNLNRQIPENHITKISNGRSIDKAKLTICLARDTLNSCNVLDFVTLKHIGFASPITTRSVPI